MKKYIIVYIGMIAILGLGFIGLNQMRIRTAHEVDLLLNFDGSCPMIRNGWVIECNRDIHRLERKYRQEIISQCIDTAENWKGKFNY